MPKILTAIKKKEMLELFKTGFSIDELANKYCLKKLTIKKHLKSLLGDSEFKKIIKYVVNKELNTDEADIRIEKDDNLFFQNQSETSLKNESDKLNKEEDVLDLSFQSNSDFIEITPLKGEFNFETRKDLTSKPLNEFLLPHNSYMVVDKNNELEVFFIKDFPEYCFLPDADQQRKIIKLFSDRKSASSFCNKNQKTIKVPNGEVFGLASSFLIKKGISRIIFDDNLLSI